MSPLKGDIYPINTHYTRWIWGWLLRGPHPKGVFPAFFLLIMGIGCLQTFRSWQHARGRAKLKKENGGFWGSHRFPEGHGLPLSQVIMVQWFQINCINGRKRIHIGGTEFSNEKWLFGWWQLKHVFMFTPILGEDEPIFTHFFHCN